jgi:prevent-host-death family protein
MNQVGVRELRQNLSRYLVQVKAGESFLVTERGREVARLTPSGPVDSPIWTAWPT